MANVEDLLRKQKDRIEKISASPAQRKKITRTGPTRPWQENLPQYQDGHSSNEAPPASQSNGSQENNLKLQDDKLPETQSTEIQSTKMALSVNTTDRPQIEESTEFKSTAFRSTEIKSTKNKSTLIETTESKSTEIQQTQIARGGKAHELGARPAGYFQLNYSAMELMRTLEAGEYVVFQFLTLKAWGWHSDKHHLGTGLVRAAGSYVSQCLGIAKSSADKYLGRLVERGLLTLIEKSHKRGNTYRVAPTLTMSNEKTDSRSTEIQPTSSPNLNQLVDRNSVSSSPKNSQLVDRNSVILVDSRYIDNRSLSQSRPQSWVEFTSQLTEKARERADRVFESIKRAFPADPVEELAECPKNLERFGAPDGTPWDQISSPIGLMDSSWPQLRDFFRKCVAETQKANLARQRIEAERNKAEEQGNREAEESQRRREAFLAAFPNEQERRATIQKYLAGFPFNPDGMIGQGIAIGKWFEDTRGDDNARDQSIPRDYSTPQERVELKE